MYPYTLSTATLTPLYRGQRVYPYTLCPLYTLESTLKYCNFIPFLHLSSETIHYITVFNIAIIISCKLSFALIRPSIISIGGARSSRQHEATEVSQEPIDPQLAEAQIH